jgi:hypothetical protein
LGKKYGTCYSIFHKNQDYRVDWNSKRKGEEIKRLLRSYPYGTDFTDFLLAQIKEHMDDVNIHVEMECKEGYYVIPGSYEEINVKATLKWG